MARLPIPGQDEANWGTLLNQFLQVEMFGDGTLHYEFAIRSAYDLPSSGAPKEHLSNDVRESLRRASSAVQPASLDPTDFKVTIIKNTGAVPIGIRKGLNFQPSASANVIATSTSFAEATVAIED